MARVFKVYGVQESASTCLELGEGPEAHSLLDPV